MPSRASFRPRSGLAPIRLRWSVRTTRLPGSQVGADAARRRGEDQGRHAELLEHAHRKGHGFEVVPLVVVESALEHDSEALRRACRRSLCLMPGDGRARKVGNPLVRDRSSARRAGRPARSGPSRAPRRSRGDVGAGGTDRGGGLLGPCVKVRARMELAGRHSRIPAMQAER